MAITPHRRHDIVTAESGQYISSGQARRDRKMQLDFGIFDHVDRGHRAVADVYKLRFALAEKCDRAGFYAFHVAEHHGTPLSCSPSPNVFLAALSQRTKHIRSAPLASVLRC